MAVDSMGWWRMRENRMLGFRWMNQKQKAEADACAEVTLP